MYDVHVGSRINITAAELAHAFCRIMSSVALGPQPIRYGTKEIPLVPTRVDE